MTRLIVAVGLAVALSAGAACAGPSRSQATYSATDMSTGASVSLSTLRGRPVILVSWTTWCTECDAELRGLQEFASSPEADGIDIVAVNLDAGDNRAAIEAKINQHHLSTRLWRDRHNDFKGTFGAIGVPTTVVLDSDGAVAGVFPGAVDFDDAAVITALDKVRAEKV